MSSRYNLILIGMMENILLQMLIEVSETFTLFTGNGFYLTSWYTFLLSSHFSEWFILKRTFMNKNLVCLYKLVIPTNTTLFGAKQFEMVLWN